MNRQQILGNLGRVEPLGYTPSGTPALKFSVASNETIRRNGQNEKHTEWFNCKMYGKRAESIAPYVIGGKKVYVDGPTRIEKYADKNGGADRISTYVLVDTFEFAEKKEGSGTSQSQPPVNQQQSAEPAAAGDDDDWGFGQDGL